MELREGCSELRNVCARELVTSHLRESVLALEFALTDQCKVVLHPCRGDLGCPASQIVGTGDSDPVEKPKGADAAVPWPCLLFIAELQGH